MDDVEGVPKSLIRWSVALLGALLLFSLISFFRLRARERRLARERVVFMDWDGVTSLAWVVTAAALVLVALLTFVRMNGYREWSLGERMQLRLDWGVEHAEAEERRHPESRDALWHIGTPIAAVVCVHAWIWAAHPKAQRRFRGPAKNSLWLLLPIGVTAGLLLVTCFVYQRAFWTPVSPDFDTSLQVKPTGRESLSTSRLWGPLTLPPPPESALTDTGDRDS